ncbi:hypothetical protein MMC17_007572 [Xylographa soralifera]|nr:hypothetical protein [Xylographa soralifera]
MDTTNHDHSKDSVGETASENIGRTSLFNRLSHLHGKPENADCLERFEKSKIGLWIEVVDAADHDFPPQAVEYSREHFQGYELSGRLNRAEFVGLDDMVNFIKERKQILALPLASSLLEPHYEVLPWRYPAPAVTHRNLVKCYQNSYYQRSYEIDSSNPNPNVIMASRKRPLKSVAAHMNAAEKIIPRTKQSDDKIHDQQFSRPMMIEKDDGSSVISHCRPLRQTLLLLVTSSKKASEDMHRWSAATTALGLRPLYMNGLPFQDCVGGCEIAPAYPYIFSHKAYVSITIRAPPTDMARGNWSLRMQYLRWRYIPWPAMFQRSWWSLAHFEVCRWSQECLSDILEEVQRVSKDTNQKHPLRFPLVLLKRDIDYTGRRLDALLEELDSLEHAIFYKLIPKGLATDVPVTEEILVPEDFPVSEDVNTYFELPLTFWSLRLHGLTRELTSLERRSDFETLLSNFLTKELEEELQWLRKHYIHEGCKAAGSIATDPNALDGIMITLTAAKARSEAQSMEIRNLSRRISSLQTVILNLGTKEDNQVVRELAEVTARDSSSMKVIAILGLLFLPATFVATLFSMPLFDWDAWNASAHAISPAKPGLWLYVVSSISITFILLLGFGLWLFMKRRSKLKQKKQTPHEEQKSLVFVLYFKLVSFLRSIGVVGSQSSSDEEKATKVS